MSGGINESGVVTFTANGALATKTRVKITSASTTTPPQVETAGAGEQHIGIVEYAAADTTLVAVRLRTAPGVHEGIASEALAVGAVLYGAASGKIKDTSDGTAIGIALEEATANNDIIKFIDFTTISTTAATVSIADAGSFTTQATVEAALQELYQNAISVQGFIPISLFQLREVATGAVGNIAANAGILASDTTPLIAPANGATDAAHQVEWVETGADPVMFQTALPPDLDDTADVVLHLRIKSAGTTDAVGFTVETWWNEGDTKISDTSETNQTATWAEKIATIAAADVPAGAQILTCILTPVAHTTDHLYLSGLWIEYKRKLVTS